MSAGRSSSAVRDLRTIFENRASENASDSRGRSPSTSLRVDSEEQRPRSKVRSNFFSVKQAKTGTDAAMADNQVPKHHGSMDIRRGSFSGGKSGSIIEAAATQVAAGLKSGQVPDDVAIESAGASAAATPLVELNQQIGARTTAGASQEQDTNDLPASNPDKPVMGAEENSAALTPAAPTNVDAVSGGDSLGSGAADLRRPSMAAPAKDAKKALPRAGNARASLSAGSKPATTSDASRKAPRSSLTAPTAASVARAAAAAEKPSTAASKQPAPTAKPKPKDATKPIGVSAHLTAPTAASRARAEPSSATAAVPAPAPKSAAPRPKSQTITTKPPARTSLAGRPESRSSTTARKTPAAPSDSSFLDRMSRPTAASNKKTQEKSDVQSPPRAKAAPALRPKTNIQAKASVPMTKSTTGAAKLSVAAPEPKVATTAPSTTQAPAASDVTESNGAADNAQDDSKPVLVQTEPASESKEEQAVKVEEPKENPTDTVATETSVSAPEPTPASAVEEPKVAPVEPVAAKVEESVPQTTVEDAKPVEEPASQATVDDAKPVEPEAPVAPAVVEEPVKAEPAPAKAEEAPAQTENVSAKAEEAPTKTEEAPAQAQESAAKPEEAEPPTPTAAPSKNKKKNKKKNNSVAKAELAKADQPAPAADVSSATEAANGEKADGETPAAAE